MDHLPPSSVKRPMSSPLEPKSPLARLFFGVGTLGALTTAALATVMFKLLPGGPIDTAIALAAGLLLCAQAAPLSGMLAWAQLRSLPHGGSRLAFGSQSPWVFAIGTAVALVVSFFVVPYLSVLVGLVSSTVFLSHRLAAGSRPWIFAWVFLSVPVLLTDVAALFFALWWRS